MDGGEEISGKFVISGGDAPEILESAEAALDDVAPFVGAFAEWVESYSVGLVRNDRLGAAPDDFGAESVAIIALVGGERACGRGSREKRRRGSNVRVLAGREMNGAGSAIGIRQRVDLGGASPRERPIAWACSPLFRRSRSDAP